MIRLVFVFLSATNMWAFYRMLKVDARIRAQLSTLNMTVPPLERILNLLIRVFVCFIIALCIRNAIYL